MSSRSPRGSSSPKWDSRNQGFISPAQLQQWKAQQQHVQPIDNAHSQSPPAPNAPHSPPPSAMARQDSQNHDSTANHARTSSSFSLFGNRSPHSQPPPPRNGTMDHQQDPQPSNMKPSTGAVQSQPAPNPNALPTPSRMSVGGQPPPIPQSALHPEIRSVVQLTLAHGHKIYFSGPLVRRVERQSDGNAPHNDTGWREVWAQLGGTTLSVWDMTAIEEANKQGKQVPPTYVNITDAFVQVLGSVTLPATANSPSKKYTNVFTLNTAGSNLLLFSCPSQDALIAWTASLRLAAWEKSRLEEIYTAHLIRVTMNDGRDTPTPLVHGKLEGWVRIRVAGQTDWKKLYMVVVAGAHVDNGSHSSVDNSNRTSSPTAQRKNRLSHLFSRETSLSRSVSLPARPLLQLYVSPKHKDRKKAVLTMRDIRQAFGVYPEKPELISRSTLMKLEGVLGDEEAVGGMKNKEGWLLVMPEMEGHVNNRAPEMLKWLIAIHDAFELYGRPHMYSWDPRDPRSLLFAYPIGPSKDLLFLDREFAETLDPRDDRTSAVRSRLQNILLDRMRGVGLDVPQHPPPNDRAPTLPPLRDVGSRDILERREDPNSREPELEPENETEYDRDQRPSMQLPPFNFDSPLQEMHQPSRSTEARPLSRITEHSVPHESRSTSLEQKVSGKPSISLQQPGQIIHEVSETSILGEDMTTSPIDVGPPPETDPRGKRSEESFGPTGSRPDSKLGHTSPSNPNAGGTYQDQHNSGSAFVEMESRSSLGHAQDRVQPKPSPTSPAAAFRRLDARPTSPHSILTSPHSIAGRRNSMGMSDVDHESFADSPISPSTEDHRTGARAPLPIPPRMASANAAAATSRATPVNTSAPVPSLPSKPPAWSQQSNDSHDLPGEASVLYYMNRLEQESGGAPAPRRAPPIPESEEESESDTDSEPPPSPPPRSPPPRTTISPLRVQHNSPRTSPSPPRRGMPGLDHSVNASPGNPYRSLRKPTGARARPASALQNSAPGDRRNHTQMSDHDHEPVRTPVTAQSEATLAYASSDADVDDAADVLAALTYLEQDDSPSVTQQKPSASPPIPQVVEPVAVPPSNSSAEGSQTQPRSSFAPSRNAVERKAKSEAQQAAHQAAVNKPGRVNGKGRAKTKDAGAWGESSDEEEEEEEEEEEDEDVDSDDEPRARSNSRTDQGSSAGSVNPPGVMGRPVYPQGGVSPARSAADVSMSSQHQRRDLPQVPGRGPGDDEYLGAQPRRNFPDQYTRSVYQDSQRGPSSQQNLLRPNSEFPQMQMGAPRQSMWSQVLDPKNPDTTRDTFVQIEPPSQTMTKAFTPHGLLSAGLQDKFGRSAKRQEEMARETGSSLINVQLKPPAPQTGLLGAVTAHERERKRDGGIGATLTEREREKRVAEERQRKLDDLQRQQLEQMQQGGSMYGGMGMPFPGYNPMMGNQMMMGMNPMMTGGWGYPGMMPGMNPQLYAQQAAAAAYQQAMMSFSTAGSQVPDQQGAAQQMNPMMTGGGMGMGFDPRFSMMGMPMMGMSPQMTGMNPQMAGMNPQMTGMGPQMAGLTPQMTGMNPQMGGMTPNMMGMGAMGQGMGGMGGIAPQMTGGSAFDARYSLFDANLRPPGENPGAPGQRLSPNGSPAHGTPAQGTPAQGSPAHGSPAGPTPVDAGEEPPRMPASASPNAR